jgi:putative Mg2+ transporter-C (MgtC) family protein
MTNLELLSFISLKMFYAVICGFIVGYERESNGASAGFKTQILVCVGSMLFTVIPNLLINNSTTDVARVIGQIITGVGFLGAGAIMHGQGFDKVVGLTTAAWIWFISGIGILVGIGYGPAATFTTVSLVLVITTARKIERAYFKQKKILVKQVSDSSQKNSENNKAA